jgi:predicted DNA-binding transcriptional regulator YafY
MPASEQVVASFSPPQRGALTGLAEAFSNMRCIAIDYVDQNDATTSREVETQFLHLNVPVWYPLAWDRLRGAIRYFRIDRIKSVTLLEQASGSPIRVHSSLRRRKALRRFSLILGEFEKSANEIAYDQPAGMQAHCYDDQETDGVSISAEHRSPAEIRHGV